MTEFLCNLEDHLHPLSPPPDHQERKKMKKPKVKLDPSLIKLEQQKKEETLIYSHENPELLTPM